MCREHLVGVFVLDAVMISSYEYKIYHSFAQQYALTQTKQIEPTLYFG